VELRLAVAAAPNAIVHDFRLNSNSFAFKRDSLKNKLKTVAVGMAQI
jgi:hypothetical protein